MMTYVSDKCTWPAYIDKLERNTRVDRVRNSSAVIWHHSWDFFHWFYFRYTVMNLCFREHSSWGFTSCYVFLDSYASWHWQVFSKLSRWPLGLTQPSIKWVDFMFCWLCLLVDLYNEKLTWCTIYCVLTLSFTSTCFGHVIAHHREVVDCLLDAWNM
jgi:hypothetical protein